MSDGQFGSRPATVVVSTFAAAPVANAGPDVLGKTGLAVALDGSRSSDPNEGSLAAAWSILGLGDQLVGTLSTPNTLSTNFNIPVAGIPLTQSVLIGPSAIAIARNGDDDDDGSQKPSLFSAGRLTSGGISYTIWRIHNPSSKIVTATLGSVVPGFSLSLPAPAQSDLFVASAVTAGVAPHKLTISGKTVATVNAIATAFSDNRLIGGGRRLSCRSFNLASPTPCFRRWTMSSYRRWRRGLSRFPPARRRAFAPRR